MGGAALRKHAERSLVVHTPRSYNEKQRESCSKNTVVSQAVWVAGCLLRLHLRLALLQRPRGMSEKREFSGSIVSTCSLPPITMSGPAHPESTMAMVNFLGPRAKLQEQPLQSANGHVNNQENATTNT